MLTQLLQAVRESAERKRFFVLLLLLLLLFSPFFFFFVFVVDDCFFFFFSFLYSAILRSRADSLRSHVILILHE